MLSSGGDYTLDTSMQHSTVREGGNAKIKCESPRPFNGCKFRSPSGEVYNIGIGGGSSYDRARIDCLCIVRAFTKYFLQYITFIKEENYDPTLVCGIYIKDMKPEDTGEWR